MRNSNRKTQKKTKKNRQGQSNKSQSHARVVTTIQKNISFPDKFKTVLRYVDNLSISGAAQQYTFRANSLFDPDLTGTGHQPYYYDQFISVYEKYRVYSTKIKLIILNGATTPCFVVVIPVSQIPTITSLPLAEELTRSRTVGPIVTNNVKPAIIRHSVSTKEILGLTGGQIYDDTFGALFSANPVDLWYYTIYVAPSTGQLTTTIRVELQFDCEFYDRAPVTLSFEQISHLRGGKEKPQNIK